MRQQFDLLVFDWDGTLMNSIDQIVHCLAVAAEDAGAPALPETSLRNIIGLGLTEAMQTLYPDEDEAMIQRLCRAYRHHFVEMGKGDSELFEGVEHMLEALLEQDFQLAVATGKARVGLKRIFDKTGYDRYFHASRCADETSSKPHPQMLHELMQELGTTPARTLMIGDSEYDLVMASNAGTASLGVSYGVHDCQRLLGHQPLTCVNTVTELHNVLCGTNDKRLSSSA
ncbi:MAG: HAD-IA family hydrolase [Granulosicoccaceae bacterium]|jgi:phosphoglycolate phosphatase